MAIAGMPSFSTWNKKAGQNVGCWLCEHFQRYDSTAQPTECEGECRKSPPRRAMQTNETVLGPSDWFQDSYFTYVAYGNVGWCNGFQASLEENIPPSPGDDPENDCAHFSVVTWTTPEAFRLAGSPNPFSKKTIENSCWHCDHFQRLVEDLEDQQSAEEKCKGYCQKEPQPAFYELDPDYTGINLGHLNNFPAWAKILFAPYQWCSKWERSLLPVPDVPELNGTNCLGPG